MAAVLLGTALLQAALPEAASAQDTTRVAPGVELGTGYGAAVPPSLAVRPFQGDDPAAAAGAIVARDLELSDRFHLFRPQEAMAGGPPDFEAWDGFGVEFVVEGEVSAAGGAAFLRLAVWDILYGRVLERGVFPLPAASAPGFRMAVHRISDEVVRWITGEPGMAASRVAFTLRRDDGGMDLMMVDADGEGLGRLAGTDLLAHSPAWSPDGRRIVHTEMTPDGTYRVLERDLSGAVVRDLTPGPGLHLTPAYTPDGSTLALSISSGAREDLYETDLTTGTRRRVESRAMAPSYSSDGRWLAFGSDRLGRPHVWVLGRDGDDDPILVSPWGVDHRADFQLPDWSPVAPVLAYHGGTGLAYQVLVMDFADPARPVRQLTWEGWSESPSWAPDGRHLVVHGVREGRAGLYVLDTPTGRTRLLVAGAGVRTPDWSPSLGPAAGAGG